MISLHVLSEHADVHSEALELHWPAHQDYTCLVHCQWDSKNTLAEVRKLWTNFKWLHCCILSFLQGQRGMAWNCCNCWGVARKCCRRCQSAWWRPSILDRARPCLTRRSNLRVFNLDLWFLCHSDMNLDLIYLSWQSQVFYFEALGLLVYSGKMRHLLWGSEMNPPEGKGIYLIFRLEKRPLLTNIR